MAHTSEQIRVMLVDDEEIARQGFRATLESDDRIVVVGEAASRREIAPIAHSCRPQVVIVEAGIYAAVGREAFGPARDGISVSPELVVIASAKDDGHLLHALRTGVSGFLLKKIKPDALIRAIHAIAAGGAVISPEMTRRLIDDFDIRPQLGRVPLTPVSPLSAREMDVLHRIAQGRSNREIAGELHLAEATVKSHVSRVLHKLGLRDRLQAASLVLCGQPVEGRSAPRRHERVRLSSCG